MARIPFKDKQTFERMLTQMELMHNVVDLDRPISIQERANCRDINHTNPCPLSRFAFPRSF
ncbi:Uncharacterized protein DBV15_02989 [Temnothorax longispinosus]|uniref:Uncharacterized protein n=1 Tax=Temnothorax longispinosus TaxID=300112 RepID=A0A4S2KDB1_9HYME|nr:Uncharacterized protein DBV15_02989 [Temnothorax longispinosus]